MRNSSSGVRRAVAMLAAAIAVLVVIPASASAASGTTLGPSSLNDTTVGSTQGLGTVLNTKLANTQIVAPANGKITGWGGNFDCADGCGNARLVTLRATQVSGAYTTVEKTDWVTPSAGPQSFLVDLSVQADDRVGLEFTDGGKVFVANAAGSEMLLGNAHSGVGNTAVYSFTEPTIALYNATFEPLLATTTAVEANPEFSLVNTPVTFDVDVTRALGPHANYPAVGGTVTLYDSYNTPIPGCVGLTVTAGEATCGSTAPATVTYRMITARYAGDSEYAASVGYGNHWTVDPAEMTAKATPNPVERSTSITYSAQIAIVQLGSVGAATIDNGTVAFFVDGQPVSGCDARPVNHNGQASCAAVAPPVVGPYTLKAVYGGSGATGPGQAEAPFDVIGPNAQAPQAVAFDPTTVGAAAARTVTLTSTGKVALKLTGASLTGDSAFSIVSDGCAQGVLEHSKTCEVTVTYRPTAAGAQTATVALGHDAGGSQVALSGTGVAPAVAPPAPTPPKPGATIDPDKKPTFTVSVPTGTGARASSVPTLQLPLRCPADTECQLNGKLTIEQSALAKASAASSTTVARFSRVQVEAGGLKTVKLKLSPAFVKSAQKRGIRRIRATLTINTVLGSGETITTAQRITIVLPKAPKKKVAAKQQVRPRFTG